MQNIENIEMFLMIWNNPTVSQVFVRCYGNYLHVLKLQHLNSLHIFKTIFLIKIQRRRLLQISERYRCKNL